MEYFNIFGLIFVAAIMIPNIIFAIKCSDGFCNKQSNKFIECTEQFGRFGCFAFMIFNIPGTCLGWWSDEVFTVYLIVNTILTISYCLIWIFCFNKNSVFRSISLSVIPSIMFLMSGIAMRSLLLILSALLFTPSHIIISYRNAKADLSCQK